MRRLGRGEGGGEGSWVGFLCYVDQYFRLISFAQTLFIKYLYMQTCKHIFITTFLIDHVEGLGPSINQFGDQFSPIDSIEQLHPRLRNSLKARTDHCLILVADFDLALLGGRDELLYRLRCLS